MCCGHYHSRRFVGVNKPLWQWLIQLKALGRTKISSFGEEVIIPQSTSTASGSRDWCPSRGEHRRFLQSSTARTDVIQGAA